MKKLFTLLALAAMTLSLSAQFIPEPQPFQVFTNAGVIYIPGATTTNIPTTMAYNLPVGKNGSAWYFGVGATNAASTTNATIVVEYVNTDTLTGAENIIDTTTVTLSVPQNGVTRYDYQTNIAATTANYGNAAKWRVRSIQNTNVLGIFITNAVLYVRE
jgi:hypothetical protein